MEEKKTYFRVPTRLAEERNLGLAILRVGHSQAHATYRRHVYHKAAFTLKVIVSGKGTLRTSAGECPMKAGDVVLYWQGQAYEWWTDSIHLLRHYWIDLEGPVVTDMFSTLSTATDCVLSRDVLPDSELVLFDQLFDLYQNHPPHYIWKSLAVFFDLWHSVTESAKCGQQATRAPAHNARSFIDTHYMVDISINDVARYVGVTPQYLAIIFKKRYGIAPHEYLLNCRLQAAARLLREGASVRKAAAWVGYDDPNYFARLFHRHMGATPSSIIRQNRP